MSFRDLGAFGNRKILFFIFQKHLNRENSHETYLSHYLSRYLSRYCLAIVSLLSRDVLWARATVQPGALPWRAGSMPCCCRLQPEAVRPQSGPRAWRWRLQPPTARPRSGPRPRERSLQHGPARSGRSPRPQRWALQPAGCSIERSGFRPLPVHTGAVWRLQHR